MTTYVLDASALLRFTDKEAGYERVRALLKQAAKGEVELLISAVNWSEIVGALYKRSGVRQSAMARVSALAANLAALPISIVPVDKGMAEGAAMFKCDFKIPLADAFAGVLTLTRSTGTRKPQATLLTADYDFKSVPAGTIPIEFLPTK
jgi:PIN domain nuclease of toxin-antitoxin system